MLHYKYSNDGQTIEINLSKMNSTTLGMDGFDATKVATKLSVGSKLSGDASGTAANVVLDQTQLDAMKDAAFSAGGSGDIYSTKDGSGNTVYIAVGKDASGADVAVTMTPTFSAGSGGAADTVTFAKGTDATADQLAGVGQLKAIDDALAQVDELRSGLGAVQNRFDSVISNLNSTVNNLSESRSRILDADFASEVSNMSRANILQSAGVTVLAQANQVPQNVLSLLR